MSFATKIDYVGLNRSGLAIKSNNNGSSNSNLEITGSDGSILSSIIFGHIKAPTCDYAISGVVDLNQLELGHVYSSQGPYALQSIKCSSGAGSEPTFTATAVQIENGSTNSICTYPIDNLSCTPARHSQTFGAFTYTESPALVLQACDFNATCTLQPTTINGDPVASDSTAGMETVNITMWSASNTQEPQITISNGWKQTADWTCQGADASMFVWTCTLTKYLVADDSRV